MKFPILNNFIVRILVVVLGTCQTVLASEGMLDFSVPGANAGISVPGKEDTNQVLSSRSESLFATSKSPGSIAVGVAEGNLTVRGKTTSLYWGHTDPGNHVTNRGFCSWNRAASISAREADRRCLAALQRQSAAIERKLRDLDINPEIHFEAVVNGADVWNQSPGAGADFAAKYKEAQDKGLRDREAFLYARVEAFRTPSGVLSASGLFGICSREGYYQRRLAGLKPYSEAWRWKCIALDQGRRVEAVSQALRQNNSIDEPVENVAIASEIQHYGDRESQQILNVRSPVLLSFEVVVDSSSVVLASSEGKDNVVAIDSLGDSFASRPDSETITTVLDRKTVRFDKTSFLAKSPKRGDKIGQYSVASPFGLRPQPCAVCSKYHNGVDVGTPMGTPLLAIALPGDAIKVSCSNTQLGGLTAIIKSESIPDKSFAAVHLSSCFAGTHKAGEIFALTGNSGQATTGPHLHWVEKVNGEYVPPQRGYVEWVVTGKIPDEFETQLTSATPSTSTKYGHFAYKEAPLSDLVEVGNGEKLRRAAAVQFREMVAAAAKQRIALVPLSGFRDISSQHRLFYDGAAARHQSFAERAKVSAPPGYSEHHTGYAIDIGEQAASDRNLSQYFENSRAFIWLLINAETYGFELSFPRNNPQGISYEPWHWRFVGDSESQEIFKAARQNKPFPI